MDLASPGDFFRAFPNLRPEAISITSPVDFYYNCIAWAAGENHRWWWPVKGYWPEGVPRELTVDAFIKAYGTLGYRPEGGVTDPDVEKLAIYAIAGEPTHASRQLQNGRWTSKCGQNVDIEHELWELEGPVYGRVVQFLGRPADWSQV